VLSKYIWVDIIHYLNTEMSLCLLEINVSPEIITTWHWGLQRIVVYVDLFCN